MNSGKSVPSVWFESTVAAAQKTLDSIVFSMKRSGTSFYTEKIQEFIDQINDGVITSTSDIVSLSLCVKNLEDYEMTGNLCSLRDLSVRLHAVKVLRANEEDYSLVS